MILFVIAAPVQIPTAHSIHCRCHRSQVQPEPPRAHRFVAVLMALEAKISAPLVLQDGWTALMVAAENGHEGVVQFLLDHGSVVNSSDRVCMIASTWLVVH